MSRSRLALSLLLLFAFRIGNAAILRVGPGERITRISDAASLAQEGDVIEIMPGEYRGDVAVWLQKSLTIRGIGARPVLVADGKHAEGKAIWVIRDGDIRVENLEFRGARVPDGNGAGIRFERGRLLVRDSAFIDNQMGILTGNDQSSELIIEDCRFSDAPRQTHSLPHLLYIGRIGLLSIDGSRFERGFRGHLIKSRARRSVIFDSHIVDGPNGEASYEIDLPNGGLVDISNNSISQSHKTQTPVLVSFGAEGNVWPESELRLIGNTLTSDYLPFGWFLKVHSERFGTKPKIQIINNRTKGTGGIARQ